MLAIFKKEIKSYFLSPMGYIFITVFFLLTAFFFYAINMYFRTADFYGTVVNMQVVLLFTCPILTMRLFAEERKTGTEQLLMTSPVSLTGITLGKYLAAIVAFLVSIIVTFMFPIVLMILGEPSIASIFGAYIGLFLLGASFISIGLFVSSLSSNQIISAVLSFGSLLVLWLIDWIAGSLTNRFVIGIVDWLSILRRSENFMRGIIEIGPVFYYLSFITLFIFLTIRVLEKRKWSEG